jgi:hypothetical protein
MHPCSQWPQAVAKRVGCSHCVCVHLAACMLYTMQFTALVVLATFAQVQMGASTGAQLPTFNHSWDQISVFWFSANTTGPEVICATRPALVSVDVWPTTHTMVMRIQCIIVMNSLAASLAQREEHSSDGSDLIRASSKPN